MKELLYEGKSKKVYTTENPNELLLVFKDDLTAFNALKKGNFPEKGAISLAISEIIYDHLKVQGFSHHWIRKTPEGLLVQKLEMVPLEVVVRNYAAGSLVKRLGFAEGEKLPGALVEFYYKSDALADPFINDDHILMLQILDQAGIADLKAKALKLNSILVELFAKARMQLVDFKVEFGRNAEGAMILGDDITPDCIRAWDIQSKQKFDKDLFRFDLGDPAKGYQEIRDRLTAAVPTFAAPKVQISNKQRGEK